MSKKNRAIAGLLPNGTKLSKKYSLGQNETADYAFAGMRFLRKGIAMG